MAAALVVLGQAKEAGRSSVRFYRHPMNHQASERIELESSLRRALDAGEFFAE